MKKFLTVLSVGKKERKTELLFQILSVIPFGLVCNFYRVFKGHDMLFIILGIIGVCIQLISLVIFCILSKRRTDKLRRTINEIK